MIFISIDKAIKAKSSYAKNGDNLPQENSLKITKK